MEFRLGDYVMDVPSDTRVTPASRMAPASAEHGTPRWKLLIGSDTWFVALRPGGTLNDLKEDVFAQTRLEILPDTTSINGIPGVSYAAPHEELTRVAWHFLQGSDLITFNLFVKAYVTKAEAESRAAWMHSLRYSPSKG